MPRRSTRSSCCRGPTRSARRGRTRSTRRASVAARYAAERRVSASSRPGSCPWPGCIAETGATLRQEQFDWLREVAGSARGAAGRHLLRSVDRFRDPELEPARRGDPRGAARPARAVRAAARGRAHRGRRGADRDRAVARRCSSTRGSASSQRVLAEQYTARAQALKARSALAALRAIGEELDRRGVAGAAGPGPAIDRLEASSQALALLRLLHLVLSGPVELAADERAEVDRLCGSGSRERAGSASTTGAAAESPRRRPRRHRALALAGGQPAERPPDDRGGRDRQPRLRGDHAERRLTGSALVTQTRARRMRHHQPRWYATTRCSMLRPSQPSTTRMGR